MKEVLNKFPKMNIFIISEREPINSRRNNDNSFISSIL